MDTDDEDDGIDLRQKAQQASTAKQSIRISAKQLTRFFDGSLWNNDFSDSPNGFYGIYRTLFETINQSEVYAAAPVGEPALSTPVHYPSFGTSATLYDAVDGQLKQFYSSFSSFASRRPFNEADKYRLQDAPDRQIRRLMDRENKKAREDARKEYNEAIRSLAAFLKKRDPRFLNSASSDPIKLKQLEKKRLEAQLRDAALQAAKKREEAAKAFVEQDWMKVQGSAVVEDDWEESADEDEDQEEGEDVPGDGPTVEAEGELDEEPADDWYCAACDKLFGSQGAWDNHERSRKHLQNTKRLRKEMLAEDESMSTSQELGTSGTATPDLHEELDIDDLEREFRKLSKKDRKRFNLQRPTFKDLDEEDQVQSVKPLGPPDTLAVQDGQNDGVSAEQADPGHGSEDGAAPELSKREKRRAREAAKKAALTSSPAPEVS